jgi:hypothetical protein
MSIDPRAFAFTFTVKQSTVFELSNRWQDLKISHSVFLPYTASPSDKIPEVLRTVNITTSDVWCRVVWYVTTNVSQRPDIYTFGVENE